MIDESKLRTVTIDGNEYVAMPLDDFLEMQQWFVELMGLVSDSPCAMCSVNPPRPATTVIADIPACEQCAREYQEAEDSLAESDSE